MKKLGKILKDRRGDISSPIIVILVTVAALAVAGMAVAWMASTGGKASNQGSLIVLGTPTVTANGNLYITVKNVGNANVTITSIRLGSNTNSSTFPISAGTSQALVVALGGSYSPGQTYNGIIATDFGTVQFSANCQ